MRVFVSSTAMDLANYRKAAEQAVLEVGWQPVLLMEHKAVPGGLTVPACQSLVQSCDLLVLIAGHRCGWIPPPAQGGDGVSSITQLEFAAWGARAKMKPTFAPLIMLAADPPPPATDSEQLDALATASQLVFRARLKSTHIVHEFKYVPAPHEQSGKLDLVAMMKNTAARQPHETAVREFRLVLVSLLGKYKAIIAERAVQEAKSSGWVMAALGVGLGLLIAGNKQNDDDDAYLEDE